MRSRAHKTPTAPLVLHRTRIHKWAMEKFGINGQMRNKLFWIFIYCFSLVKAAMNAARVCKLHNGVNRTPQFLLFSMAKGGTKTIVHLSIADLRQTGRRIYDCKLQNEKKNLIQVRNEYSPQLLNCCIIAINKQGGALDSAFKAVQQ